MFGIFKSKKDTVTIDIQTRTVVRILLIAVAFILGFLAINKAMHALVLIFTAFFLALALNAPVHWLAQRLPGKRKGSRSAATAISFLVIVLLLAGFIASIAPPLVRQTSSFISAAPRLVADVRDQDSELGKFIREHKLEKQVDTISKQLSERLKNSGGTAVSAASKVGSSIFSVLTILVLTFMMLVEGPRWIRLFEDILPDEHHPRARRLGHDMYRVVKGYVNGQVLLAALAAIFILPALILLHVSYPIALVVVVFFCGLIPLVGHTIGAIIVSTVALFHSPISAIVLLAYYFLYQQIENYVVQPRIQANSTNMSPLLVFTSVIIGVNFGGLFGGLVAIPVAGCLRIFALDYLRSRKIIDGPDELENSLTDTYKEPPTLPFKKK